MQTIFTQSNQKESREKRSGHRWGIVTLMKFSSLVLLSSFSFQPWDGLEKVLCFNEHAMVLQGFEKRFPISDACPFQARFGCQESLPQVQRLVQEESNARHFLDFDPVWPSWHGPRVNPCHHCTPGVFSLQNGSLRRVNQSNLFTKATGYQLLYIDTWHSYRRLVWPPNPSSKKYFILNCGGAQACFTLPSPHLLNLAWSFTTTVCDSREEEDST